MDATDCSTLIRFTKCIVSCFEMPSWLFKLNFELYRILLKRCVNRNRALRKTIYILLSIIRRIFMKWFNYLLHITFMENRCPAEIRCKKIRGPSNCYFIFVLNEFSWSLFFWLCNLRLRWFVKIFLLVVSMVNYFTVMCFRTVRVAFYDVILLFRVTFWVLQLAFTCRCITGSERSSCCWLILAFFENTVTILLAYTHFEQI